jgi:hypothetical protein
VFDNEELLCAIYEFSAGSWDGLVIIDPLDEKHPQPSRLRNAGSKSCCFGFCMSDRRTHGHPDETEPAFIGFPVALGGAKAETMEAKHYALLADILRSVGTSSHFFSSSASAE